MRKSKKVQKAAAEQASAAAEYGQKAFKDGLSKAQVILEDGIEQAQKLLAQAEKQARPVIKDARVKSADFAARKLDQVEPHVRSALDKVTPTVDAARTKVADDYLPRLSKSLHDAAEHPQRLAEAIKPAKQRSAGKTFLKLAVFGAILAGAVAAVRHFLAPKDDGWTAHEPSRAYVNDNDTFATAAKVSEGVASDAAQNGEPEVKEAAKEMVAEGGPVVEETDAGSEAGADAVEGDAQLADEGSKYGEGSFVGENPPEGFTIKGNERSMKYHVPGTGGYERTIAEVWFTTEEAAEAAGFTKAMR